MQSGSVTKRPLLKASFDGLTAPTGPVGGTQFLKQGSCAHPPDPFHGANVNADSAISGLQLSNQQLWDRWHGIGLQLHTCWQQDLRPTPRMLPNPPITSQLPHGVPSMGKTPIAFDLPEIAFPR